MMFFLLQQNKQRIVLIKIIFAWQPATNTFATHGDLAQLVERLHGMQEVSGSTPLISTNKKAFKIKRLFNFNTPIIPIGCLFFYLPDILQYS